MIAPAAAAYSPFWIGTPAIPAYPRFFGTTSAVTAIPASRSPRNHSRRYSGNHPVIGRNRASLEWVPSSVAMALDELPTGPRLPPPRSQQSGSGTPPQRRRASGRSASGEADRLLARAYLARRAAPSRE